MQIKKFNYFRNKQHLKNVASLPCQYCFTEGQTQAAHSNQLIHGKGRGIKASDEYTAALCQACHYEIDQGKDLSKEERQRKWAEAHIGTVLLLCRQGKWPPEVSLPFVAEFE